VGRKDRVLGQTVVRRMSLHGGCIADVAMVELANGAIVVEKRRRGVRAAGDLELEAWMLDYLARESRLPVPEVLLASADQLVLSYVPHEAGNPAKSAQIDAARQLAALHDVTQVRFGLERDTLIGPLAQANALSSSWVDFFREHRLLGMTAIAAASGRLPSDFVRRLERLAAKLDSLLAPPEAASLLHGDLWAGNLLFGRDRVAAFIDPAIYYGHPEVELAYTTLFGGFGERFYAAYAEARGIAPGFFRDRADLYNLYPLLVHAELFGSGYLAPIDRTLRCHGL
jgi:fructosamine-3-kinase